MKSQSDAPCDRFHGFAFLRWRKPCSMPMAYWQYVQPYLWVIRVSCLAVCFTGGFSFYFFGVWVWNGWSKGNAIIGSSRVDPSWFPPIVVLSVAAMEVLKRTAKARYRRFILSRNRSICTNCGYDLAGLPSEYVCPECGESYSVQQVHEQWDAWFGMGERKAKATDQPGRSCSA